MLRTCLAAALTLCLAPMAEAACTGRNQIDLLPPEVRADLVARVEAAPFARGNFWRATRGDQVITLIGTYHLDDPRFDTLMEQVGLLVDASDTVLVEAGPVEEAELQNALASNPALMFVMDGPTLPETLPSATWDKLKTALSARGIPPFMGAKMQPAYLSMLLGIPPCAAEALQGKSNGLDQRIIDKAAEVEVPVQGAGALRYDLQDLRPPHQRRPGRDAGPRAGHGRPEPRTPSPPCRKATLRRTAG